MEIPYRTAKFKSANILAIVILGSTAKFNSRQYFRLYGNEKFANYGIIVLYWCTGSFYSAPPVDSFLPSQKQQVGVSPASSRVSGSAYFKSSSVRRNLSVDLGPHQLPVNATAAGDENDFQQPKR